MAELSVEGDRVSSDHNLILPAEASGWFVDPARRNVPLAAGSSAIDMGAYVRMP